MRDAIGTISRVLLVGLSLVLCVSQALGALPGMGGKERNVNEFIQITASGDVAAVKLFLSKGMDVNATDANCGTALMRAALAGRTEIVALLLANGANVNAKTLFWETALMNAALAGHLPVVKMLVEQGADIGTACEGGGTAISRAVQNGHPEVVVYFRARYAAESKPCNWTPQ